MYFDRLCSVALWDFLTVLWVGLQCVIMVFPDHTHLLFSLPLRDDCKNKWIWPENATIIS